jgi:hypothetical protein
MKISPFRSSVNYGAMSALTCFAMFLLIYWMGSNPLGPASWLAVWIPPLFIYFSIKYYRNKVLGGTMKFGEGFMAGMLTAISGGILYSLLIVIFGKIIDPNLIDNFKETMLLDFEKNEKMMREFMGDNIFERGIEDIKNMTLSQQASSDFFTKTIGGTIYSLIIAGILKRNPSAPV